MKICLINNLYKPYARGGAETVVELTANGLKNKSCDVFIITVGRRRKTKRARAEWTPKARPSRADARQEIYYIDGIYYDLNKVPKFLRLFWHIWDMFDVGSYFFVRRVLKKEKPDIVMTHNLKGVGYLVPAAIRGLKIKHIHALHDIQLLHPSGLMFYGKEKIIDGTFAKVYRFMCRRLFGSPDAVISPSEWLLSEHIKRGFFQNSKKAVLPNPMKEGRRPTNSGRRGSFKFLYVGQIEEHKGVLFLINAFRRFEFGKNFPKGGAKPELLIVGDGSKSKQAEELAAGDENIKLLGRMKNGEVMELMRISDCLVMPSLCYENSPTVICEAISAGLPVVASRIGGVPELAEKDLLFEPENERDLIRKMELAFERGRRRRAAAKPPKLNGFDIENYVGNLLKLP